MVRIPIKAFCISPRVCTYKGLNRSPLYVDRIVDFPTPLSPTSTTLAVFFGGILRNNYFPLDRAH